MCAVIINFNYGNFSVVGLNMKIITVGDIISLPPTLVVLVLLWANGHPCILLLGHSGFNRFDLMHNCSKRYSIFAINNSCDACFSINQFSAGELIGSNDL